jgi:hypothetical protein
MEPVVVHVAFSYAATYTMPRRRKAETGYFRATTPLLFPALAEDDAPVVCRVRDGDADERSDVAVRFHDGRFWRPLAEEDRRTPFALDRLREAAAGGTPWRGNPFIAIADPRMDADEHHDRHSGRFALPELRTIEEAGVRMLHRSGLGDAAARLAAAQDRFRVVGGILHVECDEPRIVLSIRHSWLTLELATSSDTNAEDWVSETFRPDRMEEALRLADHLAESEGIVRNGTFASAPEVECPRPDLLARSDLVDMAKHHAPRLMERIRKHVAALPDDEVVAFLRMRSAAMTLADGPCSETDALAFVEAVAAIARAAKAIRESREPGSWQVGEFVDKARHMLTRWRLTEGGPDAELDAEDEIALEAAMGAGR